MDEQMIRKKNMKIFPIYKMFAWDLLFHYSVIFLFLTQIKGFSASQILFADSFYGVFRIIFQILCVNIVDTIGKQKALLLGNILVTISMIGIAIGNGLLMLISLYLIQAIGYNFKGICEPTILSDSIPKSSVSSKIYLKIDGKGSSRYYIFNAISSASTGFLYIINPYIPIFLCCASCLIATFIALSFGEPICFEKKSKKIGFIACYKETFSTFKQIVKSNRLKSLLTFSLCFTGIICVFGTLRSSILVDIGVPEQYFGIVLTFMQITSAISAKKQYWFHNILKNRVLTWFSLSIVTSFIFTGLIIICNIGYIVSLISTLITIMIVGIVKGPFFTLFQRYLNSFSNPKVNTKIFAVESILANLGRVLISLFASFLLSITSTAYTYVIIGCVFFIIFVFLLDYMKTKVGLKPEEYPKEDLVFSNEIELKK